jgi:hypothetical protein
MFSNNVQTLSFSMFYRFIFAKLNHSFICPMEIHSIEWHVLQIYICQAQSQLHLSHGNTLYLLVCSRDLYLPSSVTASSVPWKNTPSTGTFYRVIFSKLIKSLICPMEIHSIYWHVLQSYICQAHSQPHLFHENTLHLLTYSTDLYLPSSVTASSVPWKYTPSTGTFYRVIFAKLMHSLICLMEIHSIYWHVLQSYICQAHSQPNLSHGITLHLLACSTELYLPSSFTASLSHGNTLHLLACSSHLYLPSSVKSSSVPWKYTPSTGMISRFVFAKLSHSLICCLGIHIIEWNVLQIYICQAQSQPHLLHWNTLHQIACSIDLYLPSSITASSVPWKYTPSTGMFYRVIFAELSHSLISELEKVQKCPNADFYEV